jgi:hypothetical protein
MGAVEDIRKVIQDLIAPDLKAQAEGLKAVNSRLDALERHLDKRFEDQERVATLRHDALIAQMASFQSAILNAIEVDKRLTRLESQSTTQIERRQA